MSNRLVVELESQSWNDYQQESTMPVEHSVYEPHCSDMRQLVEDKIQELTEEANASLFAALVQLLTKVPNLFLCGC